MASHGRVCKIVICNGESVIICGPAWWMQNIANGSSGAWMHCLLGHREFARFRDPNTNVEFTMEKRTGRGISRSETRGTEEEDLVTVPTTDQTTTAFLGVGALYIPLIIIGILVYVAFKGK